MGGGLLHLALEAGAVGVFACVAAGRSRRVSSSAAALGLVTSSAVLVHLSGGLVEMHFHFFVMVGILTLYQSWVPFLFAIGFMVLRHGIVGTLAPGQVYNHADAIAHPLKWALVHGGFVLAASVASIVAWRLNEEQALKDSLTGLPNRRRTGCRAGDSVPAREGVWTPYRVLGRTRSILWLGGLCRSAAEAQRSGSVTR